MNDGMFAKQFESIEKRAIDGFWDQHATAHPIPGYEWCPKMQWYVEPLSRVQERVSALMIALNAGKLADDD